MSVNDREFHDFISREPEAPPSPIGHATFEFLFTTMSADAFNRGYFALINRLKARFLDKTKLIGLMPEDLPDLEAIALSAKALTDAMDRAVVALKRGAA